MNWQPTSQPINLILIAQQVHPVCCKFSFRTSHSNSESTLYTQLSETPAVNQILVTVLITGSTDASGNIPVGLQKNKKLFYCNSKNWTVLFSSKHKTCGLSAIYCSLCCFSFFTQLLIWLFQYCKAVTSCLEERKRVWHEHILHPTLSNKTWARHEI